MKKVTSLFVMSLAMATSLYAQVKFIPKVGTSSANVSLDDGTYGHLAIDYGHKAGMIIGIAAGIPLGGDRVFLQPELLFHQKGYTFKYDDGHLKGSYKYTLNYLETAVLAGVNFGKFYIATGPYIGFGVGGNYQGSETYLGQTTDYGGKVVFGHEPENYGGGTTLYVNSYDFGILLGAGVKVSVIIIDLRFGLGLPDIIDDFNSETRNRSLQLTVGLPIIAKK